MPPLALIVDTDVRLVSALGAPAEGLGYQVISCTNFAAARDRLQVKVPDALVANLRLAAFNGIHLAYLAKQASPGVRVIIYADEHDALLAREAQRAGAFYERQTFLPLSLQSYLTATLPSRDRRSASLVGRRTLFRGGRRTIDVSSLHSVTAT